MLGWKVVSSPTKQTSQFNKTSVFFFVSVLKVKLHILLFKQKPKKLLKKDNGMKILSVTLLLSAFQGISNNLPCLYNLVL
jgi:hypothetical protein